MFAGVQALRVLLVSDIVLLGHFQLVQLVLVVSLEGNMKKIEFLIVFFILTTVIVCIANAQVQYAPLNNSEAVETETITRTVNVTTEQNDINQQDASISDWQAEQAVINNRYTNLITRAQNRINQDENDISNAQQAITTNEVYSPPVSANTLLPANGSQGG